jgi:uncharacterized protein
VTLPDLGVGIIHLPGLEPLVEAAQDLLDVVEIEPQTSWYRSTRGYRERADALARVEELPYPALVHGVGFPVGGTHPPDPAAVALFAGTVARLSAPWCSEHLSFNRFTDGEREHGTLFLLPPVQTPAAVAVAAANIRRMQQAVGVPFAFETGVNYLRPQPGELTDGAFFAAVAEAADCGILLDLHNLWCNERNGRQPVLEVLAELPLERVWEVHLAGGQELDGFWLDAHSGPVPDDLMALAGTVLPTLPNVHAVIFEMGGPHLTPGSLPRLVDQLELIRGLWDSRGRSSAAPGPVARAPHPPTGLPAPADWETALGRAVTGAPGPSADPGIGVIRRIVQQARAGMVTEGLPRSVRLVLLAAGEARLQALLADFWSSASPEQFAGREAAAFGRHLLERAGDIPYLADTVSLELALLRAQEEDAAQEILLTADPARLLAALGAGTLPTPGPAGPYLVTVPAP